MTKIQGRNTPRSHCERNTRMQEQNFPNVGSRYVVYSLLFPLQCRRIPSYSPNTTKRRWSDVQVTPLRQTERDSVSEVEMDCKNLGCRKGVGACGWLWHLGWDGAGSTEQNWSLWLTTVIIGFPKGHKRRKVRAFEGPLRGNREAWEVRFGADNTIVARHSSEVRVDRRGGWGEVSGLGGRPHRGKNKVGSSGLDTWGK